MDPITANTEAWDGTSWTEVNNMATARYGSKELELQVSNAFVAVEDNTPSASYQTATEEFTAGISN